MGITDFEFKVRGLLEAKLIKYRNSIPRKAVIELLEKTIQVYNEQNGREKAFEPPIKVGDLLYPICYDHVAKKWVIDDEPERINEVGTKYFFLSGDYEDPTLPDEYHTFDEIGNEYFLTREEGEAEIKKLNEV